MVKEWNDEKAGQATVGGRAEEAPCCNPRPNPMCQRVVRDQAQGHHKTFKFISQVITNITINSP